MSLDELEAKIEALEKIAGEKIEALKKERDDLKIALEDAKKTQKVTANALADQYKQIKQLEERIQNASKRIEELEGICEEQKETIKLLDKKAGDLDKELEVFSGIRDAFNIIADRAAERAVQKALASMPVIKSAQGLKIEAEELKVSIEHSEVVQQLSTKTGLGKIMYVCLKDLQGKPSSEAEISDALQENGWPMAHSTLAPNLAQLVKQGLLVKMGGKPIRYRSPGKVKLEVKEA